MNSVYIVWAENGDLLYVGHTEATVEHRLRQHAYPSNRSPWADRVHAVDVVEVDDYAEGLRLERTLIAELQPLYNVMNNPRFGRVALGISA